MGIRYMRQMFNPANRLFLMPLLALLVIILQSTALGQDPFTVRILALEGQVEVRRLTRGQAVLNRQVLPVSIVVRPHDLLVQGDTVITGRNGRLVLGLTDGSQVVIAPKSTIEIEDITKSPRHLLNVIKGKTRLQIEKLGGMPNPYRVNTPTTVIAVRGTIFDVLVDGDRTEIYLHDGEVEVANRLRPDQPLLLPNGTYTSIRGTSPPLIPRIFKDGRNDRSFQLRSRQVPSIPSSTRPGGDDSSGASGGESRSPRRGDSRFPQSGDGPGRRPGDSPRSRPGGGRP